jgi:hypothetical protein
MPRTAKESRPRILTRTTSFDDLYEEGPEDECWIWQGSVDPSTGYGRYGKRRAHVIACERLEPRPSGKHVTRHSCNQKLCVNPAHLCWGTQAENMADVARAGNRKGENQAMSKLTEEQVREIRSCDESTKSLAKRFGVHPVTIRDVRNRRTWSHIE